MNRWTAFLAFCEGKMQFQAKLVGDMQECKRSETKIGGGNLAEEHPDVNYFSSFSCPNISRHSSFCQF